ncbi:MAG: DMT family transporter [Thermoanaerobaculia bacterium]|nr:DMT family transporter [Thermoanaerobaculia bacterium]
MRAKLPVFPLILLTLLTLVAFAGNSLLCRLALRHSGMDAASFTTIRLVSGAVILWLIARGRPRDTAGQGSWSAALALFAYAAAFSFAYLNLTVATGALLLFGAVQGTMIGYGIRKGERLSWLKATGIILAILGLVGLLLPGLSAPPPGASALMLAAGIAWGIYTLLGRKAGDPVKVTAGNFLRAAPMALALSLLTLPYATLDQAGIGYALASGALASGIGYVLWYTVLPQIKTSTAATLQLSVPVIAAAGGILFLGEPITIRLLLASATVLGGIALVVLTK